jgi:hypothetical protein
MKNFYTTFTIFSAVTFHALLPFCALGAPASYTMADDPTVTEKGRDGECIDYTLSLCPRRAANGIHGRLIFYHWDIRNASITGSHVLVENRLPSGSERIVDNEILDPKRVPAEATPMQLLFQLSGDASAPVDVELQDGLNHLSYF